MTKKKFCLDHSFQETFEGIHDGYVDSIEHLPFDPEACLSKGSSNPLA
jgi:hypothetical protein